MATTGDDKGKWFATTSWTVVEEAQTGSAESLERLCKLYWYPLYAFIRRRGHSAQDAEDLTQGFFHELLTKNFFTAADRNKGKFRSFLLVSLKYYLENQRTFQNAKKRGGGVPLVSLDDKEPEERYALEPVTETSPEKLFDQHWAQSILMQVQAQLREEYRQKGKIELFDKLKTFLSDKAEKEDYHRMAETLEMTPNTLAVTVHRLRQRNKDLLRAEIARTVTNPEDVESELKHFYESLTQ